MISLACQIFSVQLCLACVLEQSSLCCALRVHGTDLFLTSWCWPNGLHIWPWTCQDWLWSWIFHKNCNIPYNTRVYILAAAWENGINAYAKRKAQISCAVTAQLISTFVFAAPIVQFLLILNPKFQASYLFLWLYRPVCVGPGQKPCRPVFSGLPSWLL